ncbi:STAS domain-containing protein [Halobacillus litoralis]|uniref:STAS domain-containing protein n=1 Tax=Halobacillus litoralis TaxID=45668 RepID=UPI001CD3BD90|nr:STAS domain-containing protein [Halobacillus litoralis]MCA0971211.1 STAS domain-containing protein [Halobacillus litoralis]
MSEELLYIGEKIMTNHRLLAERVEQMEELEGEHWSSQEFIAKREHLFTYLGSIISGDMEVDEAEKKIKRWSVEIGNLAIEVDIELNHLLHTFSLTRKAIWSIFEDEIEENHFSPSTILEVNRQTMPLLDTSIYYITKVYLKHHKEDWKRTQATIAKLSAPMVPVTEGVAVLTVVGEIDGDRAQYLMESSLSQVASMDLNHLLIDVSGVPVIDTVVASHLFQVIQAMELVGVDTTLTGMRAEIAKAVVDMGIEFTSVKTKASVQQALSSIGFEKK